MLQNTCAFAVKIEVLWFVHYKRLYTFNIVPPTKAFGAKSVGPDLNQLFLNTLTVFLKERIYLKR